MGTYQGTSMSVYEWTRIDVDTESGPLIQNLQNGPQISKFCPVRIKQNEGFSAASNSMALLLIVSIVVRERRNCISLHASNCTMKHSINVELWTDVVLSTIKDPLEYDQLNPNSISRTVLTVPPAMRRITPNAATA